MSILLDALKKSQRDKSIGQKDFTVASAKPGTETPRDASHISWSKISAAFAVATMILYILAVSLTGKTPSGTREQTASTDLAAPDQKSNASVEPQTESVWQENLPKLEGIVWDPQAPLVILDGKPLTIGQMSGRWLITSITPDEVSLSREGINKTLTLPQTQTRP